MMMKGRTLEGRFGNATGRVGERGGGMVNGMGVENAGVKGVVENELLWLEESDMPIIGNVAG